MKLRVKGNSMRLRLSQSEVSRLARKDQLEETIYFAPQPDARLTYALAVAASGDALSLQYDAQKVTIFLEAEAVARWAATADEVGIYGDVDSGQGKLALMIEKDFACLDGSDEDNTDTFPNPSECSPVAKNNL